LTGGDTAVFATGYSNITGIRFNPSGSALYIMSRGYSTGTIDTTVGGTERGLSRVYKVSYDFPTSIRAAAAEPARRTHELLALDARRILKVPAGAIGVALFDLKGVRLWEVQGLVSGALVELPGSLPRGVARAVWTLPETRR
jgi:hypothetical protein